MVYKRKDNINNMKPTTRGKVSSKEIPFKEIELEILWQKMATAIRASGTHIKIDD